MKQFLFSLLFLTLLSFSIACNLGRENTVVANPVQIAPDQQSINETNHNSEPTKTPLTEKDLKRRAEVHKQMLKGEYLHDGAIELQSIGDISSVPALLIVLKKNPPSPNGSMICTTAHALQALVEITGVNAGKNYEEWNDWWEKYQEAQKSEIK